MGREPFKKKKVENTPIPRREHKKEETKRTSVEEILKENKSKESKLSKNFSKLDKNNTSEFESIKKDTLESNRPLVKGGAKEEKVVEKASATTTREKSINYNVAKHNTNQHNREKIIPANQNRTRAKRKRPLNPVAIGIIGIVFIIIAATVFLISTLGKKEKTPVVNPDIISEFSIDSKSNQSLENYTLKSDNSDLRYDILNFFEENITSENFLKAMIYNENLDGKTATPDLTPRVEAAAYYNSDVKGWLRVKDSNVNIGVVQNLDGNDYYTWKGYDAKYSKHAYGTQKYYKDYGVAWAGSNTVLTGTRNDLTKNTVIFGHNWENISATPRIKDENDIMFEQLAAYVYQDFATEHPYINFSTGQDNMVFVVVAAFYTEDYWQDYNKNLDFNYISSNLDDTQAQKFVDEIIARTQYNIENIEVTKDDKFLTLSTCTRAVGRHDRQRFAVIAKLVDEKNLPSEVTYLKNENYKKPAV